MCIQYHLYIACLLILCVVGKYLYVSLMLDRNLHVGTLTYIVRVGVASYLISTNDQPTNA